MNFQHLFVWAFLQFWNLFWVFLGVSTYAPWNHPPYIMDNVRDSPFWKKKKFFAKDLIDSESFCTLDKHEFRKIRRYPECMHWGYWHTRGGGLRGLKIFPCPEARLSIWSFLKLRKIIFIIFNKSLKKGNFEEYWFAPIFFLFINFLMKLETLACLIFIN